MPVPIYPTRGTKPADWWYRILLIVGTGAGYYSTVRTPDDTWEKLDLMAALKASLAREIAVVHPAVMLSTHIKKNQLHRQTVNL